MSCVFCDTLKEHLAWYEKKAKERYYAAVMHGADPNTESVRHGNLNDVYDQLEMKIKRLEEENKICRAIIERYDSGVLTQIGLRKPTMPK